MHHSLTSFGKSKLAQSGLATFYVCTISTLCPKISAPLLETVHGFQRNIVHCTK